MDTINGFTILTPFKQVNGGQCEWAQAEKDGTQYFIKRFLRPTYPAAGLGSPETQARKRKECEAFERRHQDMRRRLEAVSAGDGNLVTTKDFFRHKAHFYKTTDWIDIGADALETIRSLPNMDKFTIALTAVHCVQGLHRADIVHGDLKPNNILIMKTAMSYAARLIDFDDSYVTGDPPKELIGTQDYYATEVFRYIKGESPGSEMTTKADVFSLGIILCEYFTAKRPVIVGKGTHPDTIAEAVIKGFALDTSLGSGIDDLVQRMLRLDPRDRPDCQTVIADLKKLKSGMSPGSSSRPTSTLKPKPGQITITTTMGKPAAGGATTREPADTLTGGGITITTTMGKRKPPDARATPTPPVADTPPPSGSVPGPFDEPTIKITVNRLKTS